MSHDDVGGAFYDNQLLIRLNTIESLFKSRRPLDPNLVDDLRVSKTKYQPTFVAALEAIPCG